MATTAKTPEFTATGENISYAVVDDELIIKVDLTYRGEVNAKSGKTRRIASTLGNKEIVPGVYVGFNAYEYVTAK